MVEIKKNDFPKITVTYYLVIEIKITNLGNS